MQWSIVHKTALKYKKKLYNDDIRNIYCHAFNEKLTVPDFVKKQHLLKTIQIAEKKY